MLPRLSLLGIHGGMCAAVVLMATSSVRADVIDATTWTENWNDAVWGTPAAGPTSEHDYIVRNGIGEDNYVRTLPRGGASADATFAGNSLTIGSGMRLLVKQGNHTATANLILDGGQVWFATDAHHAVATMAGTIVVNSASTVAASRQFYNPHSRFTSAISGAGDLKLLQATVDAPPVNPVIFEFLGDMSAYTGTMIIENNWVGAWFSQVTDMTSAALLLETIDSNVQVDQSLTLGSLRVAGGNVAGGTYTTDQLSAIYGGNFTGNGTITVVPEPASLALLGLGATLMMRRRNA